MRIIVIGGTGNLGTQVCSAIQRRAPLTEVVAVARRAPRVPAAGLQVIQADIAEDDLDPILTGADAVVLLAWLIQPSHDREHLERVNVLGTERVLEAAGRVSVPAVVYGSSVGAYGPGPGPDRLVDETWPTTGIAGNLYSEQKARTERLVDAFERQYPDTRVARVRPALIFQRGAATGIRRLFLGPLAPTPILSPGRVPFIPRIPGLVTQAVHASDVGDAFARVVLSPDARGAYNVAADPILTPESMAAALDSRVLPVPRRLAHAVAEGTWRAHLQPTPGSWLDLAIESPLMSAERIHRELGWTPRRTATSALRELVQGMRDGADRPTPPLSRASSGRFRRREFATRIGGRDGAL